MASVQSRFRPAHEPKPHMLAGTLPQHSPSISQASPEWVLISTNA